MDAARRELEEECGLSTSAHVEFHPVSYTTTDAIYEDEGGRVLYHYVIAQTMAAVNEEGVRSARASDDAADLGWFTLEEIRGGKVPTTGSGSLVKLVTLCERLVRAGLLEAQPPEPAGAR